MKSLHIIRLSVFLLLANLSFCQSDDKRVIFKEQTENGAIANESNESETEKNWNMDFYNLTVKDIEGKDFSFKQLMGKKVVIVNTASKCGYTRQYEELQSLYSKYKSQNLVIIGVPSNDFGNQEPGTNKEIVTFCSKNYGVTFPMMSKSSVAKGKDMCELYQYLTQYSKNGVLDSAVEWNFQKYLINSDGNLHAMLPSKASLLSNPEFIEWVTSK